MRCTHTCSSRRDLRHRRSTQSALTLTLTQPHLVPRAEQLRLQAADLLLVHLRLRVQALHVTHGRDPRRRAVLRAPHLVSPLPVRPTGFNSTQLGFIIKKNQRVANRVIWHLKTMGQAVKLLQFLS